MWTDITRKRHSRSGLRYPSDLRDDEWELIAPLLPPGRTGGRPRETDLREVMNAILYLATGGCQWRMLPKDFPPLSTVQRYFYAWRTMGLWQAINHILVMTAREIEGREASPTAGVIDSQSVKTTETKFSEAKVAEFAATTQARRSKAGSGTSSLTPAASCYSC